MVKIGISLGDPTGINGEILLKALKKVPKKNISYIIYGSEKTLDNSKNITGINIKYEKISNVNDVKTPGIYLINLSNEDFKPGNPSVKSGKASIIFLKNAVKDTIDKKLDALVTLPISKYWIMESGFPYAGHTDYLADISSTKDYAMVLMCKKMKVALITTHIPIKDVPKNITQEKILRKIKLLVRELKEKFSISNPKIAVLGLNPHASDSGNIGDEEEKIIKPALNKLKEEGVDVIGPLSPDTAFNNYKNYDLYVAMYHDQGLIPLKMLCFRKAINITLGLPFIRTSPDHGTAYDIAGKNIADPSSLIEAIKLSIILASNTQNKNHYQKS